MRRLRESEPESLLVRRTLDLHRLQLRSPRVQRLRHTGSSHRLAAHLIGQRLEPLDLGLLARGDLGQPLFVAGARCPVLAVRASVLDDPVAIEVQDARDRGIQQAEVVADHHERALVRREEAHEPGLRVDVQVVRGLVEQQEVGPAEQDLGELQAAALATGEGLDRQREPLLRQAEAGHDRLGLRLGLVAAEQRVLLLETGEASDRPLVV